MSKKNQKKDSEFTNAAWQRMKDSLDQKGPGFCLAKWTQVTTHLGSGITHSCHHVGAHKIPVEEIEKNPNALHNTFFKKQIRKQMLEGKRPDECDYCWRIEDNTNSFSDRVYKSQEPWSRDSFDKIFNSSWEEDFYPKSVEVSFNNTCNFKCAYCGPAFSSKWTEEIQKFGAYELPGHNYNNIVESEKQIPNKDVNPYIEAFWKWFPEAVTHMYSFRITGGEPLLSKHTFKVIDYLLENPKPNLKFAINTNGFPPKDLWQEFVTKIKKLEENNCVKNITIFTSAEAVGEQCEYIRDGMNFDLFAKNIRYLLNETTNVTVSFMAAFNLLSIPTFYKFLQYVESLKRRYIRVFVDTPFVRNPNFLDARIVDYKIYKKYMKPCIDYVESSKHFNLYETNKIKRLCEDIESFHNKLQEKNKEAIIYQTKLKRRLVHFIGQYDARRNKNFINIFPELNKFYVGCQNT